MLTRFGRSLVVSVTAGLLLAAFAGCAKKEEAKPAPGAAAAEKQAAKTADTAKKETAAAGEKAAEQTKTDVGKAAAELKGAAQSEASKLADAAVPPEAKTKLAAADELDGKVDKIVAKCAACELNMDGKPEYKLEIAGYTMQFCSEKCRDAFAKDTIKAILALTIPEKK